ncbi:Sphingosine N-acyltransferase lag1 [Tilletia horrida]|nr:Sphingosine N-acyltransferase lag1 [Tilletia horrida]
MADLGHHHQQLLTRTKTHSADQLGGQSFAHHRRTQEARARQETRVRPNMDLLHHLRDTPTTKHLPTDAAIVLATATGWTILRALYMRLVLRPIAVRYVVSVSPDQVSNPAQDLHHSQNGAGEKGSHASEATSRGNGDAQALTGSRKSVPLTKRERRRIEHQKRRNEIRFAEQGWSASYYTLAFSVGLPWWPLHVKQFWTNYPELQISMLLRCYYLGQTAFYLHQIYVLFSEKWRKDHWQMFSHHVITVSLQAASYATHYHRVGVAIMLLLDPCDILLSSAKMLRYAGFQTVCDVFFGLFLVSWLFFRHILFNIVIYSAAVDIPLNPNADSSKGDFSTPANVHSMVALLVALQIILLIWFWMIVKVAYRVITGSGATDTRSDDEDSDEMDDSTEDADDDADDAKQNGHGLNGKSSALGSSTSARKR